MLNTTNITITAVLLWPSCATFDPCAKNNPLQVDPDVEEACEGSGETSGDDFEDIGQGELGLIWPMPSLQTPDYGFLDIANPPAGHTYNEIAWEDQRFPFSCNGAAPGVNNCAVGITGQAEEFSPAFGVALCDDLDGGWHMPEIDPGWLVEFSPGPMTDPMCEWEPVDPNNNPYYLVCQHGVTCRGPINGDPNQTPFKNNYWDDCYCDCQTDADCPTYGGLELACEMGMCLPPFASPPAPAGGPTVYGLSEWSTDLRCASGSCTLSRRLVQRIGHSAALVWDDFDISVSPTGGNVTLTAVGVDSLPDAIGLQVGDLIGEANLRGVLVALLSGRPTTLSVMRGTASVVIALDVL